MLGLGAGFSGKPACLHASHHSSSRAGRQASCLQVCRAASSTRPQLPSSSTTLRPRPERKATGGTSPLNKDGAKTKSQPPAGRSLQPRPSAPWDPSSNTSMATLMPSGSVLPKLVVFDLDHTLWTPELYTLRHLPGYTDALPPGPVAGKDVWLLDGAAAALHELATCPRWAGAGVKIAVASRTNKVKWAESLLKAFTVPGVPDRTLASMISFTEIFPGSKVAHFERLRKDSGISYDDMLFFDDAATGKYGNCEPVAKLGVMSAHCPDGLTSAVWTNALKAYAHAKKVGEATGKVLSASQPSDSQTASIVTPEDSVRMPIFSMNMPFAGLVACGYKVIESRNSPIFKDYAGKKLLLHVGRRTYPDGGMHKTIMSSNGSSQDQIEELTNLPHGFSRGQIVAIVELGETRLIQDPDQRSTPALERACVATGPAMGRYLTDVIRAEWLQKPVTCRGQAGVFQAVVTKSVLPEGWTD